MDENFTKLPNQLIDLLMSNQITNSEKQIMLCVARKTLGFHKAKDSIPLSQFERLTGLSRKSVIAALSTLVTRRLLVKKAGSKRIPNTWAISDDINLAQLVTHASLVTYTPLERSTPSKERDQNKEVTGELQVTDYSNSSSYKKSGKSNAVGQTPPAVVQAFEELVERLADENR